MVETGLFYSSVIDPMLKGMRNYVNAQISKDETVIDIACGTGAQAFVLADKAKRVTGIDLSESMIRFASKKSNKLGVTNTVFKVADATNLSDFADNTFDVATMSLALHQFPPELYALILNEMKRVAKRIVIADYNVPLPNNLVGYASKTIEFLAGREHNRCFRKYYKAGGLNVLLPKHGLQINSQKQFAGGAFVLVSSTVVQD